MFQTILEGMDKKKEILDQLAAEKRISAASPSIALSLSTRL